MKQLITVIFLIFPFVASGQVDPKKLQKNGWRRDSHVIGTGKEPDYLLFKRGREELKCYLLKSCTSRGLYDCIDHCGEKPKVKPRVKPPIEKARPNPPKFDGTTKKGKPPPQKIAASPQQKIPDPTERLLQGYTNACYLGKQATLGNFKGVAFGKFAVFQKTGELYTCEIDLSEKCSRLAHEQFLPPCLKVGTCTQNFKSEAEMQRSPNCRRGIQP